MLRSCYWMKMMNKKYVFIFFNPFCLKCTWAVYLNQDKIGGWVKNRSEPQITDGTSSCWFFLIIIFFSSILLPAISPPSLLILVHLRVFRGSRWGVEGRCQISVLRKLSECSELSSPTPVSHPTSGFHSSSSLETLL